MDRRGFLLTVALLACVLGLTSTTYTQDVSEGEVRAEATFGGRTVAVSFAPLAASDDPMYGALLSGDSDVSVQVGQLEANPLVRIGTIEPTLEPSGDDSVENPTPAERRSPSGMASPVRVELLLTHAGQRWELQTDQGNIPLTHETTDRAATTLFAAILPITGSTGQLLLRWGHHEWTAPFEFSEAPPRPRSTLSRLAGARTAETDTRPAARRGTLGELNETAVVLPDASRMSVLFRRGLEPEADMGYGLVESTAEGEVVLLTHAPVIRLKNEAPLRFDGVSLPTGNLAPGIPGAYGLWLKKAASGWRLVLNNEPDSWGSQHDPAFDVGDIELTHHANGDTSRPLGVTLVPVTANSGRLVVQWGPHEWAADFSVGS